MAKKIGIAGIATVIMFLIMRWLGIGLQSIYSPMGIVSFELAKNFTEANNIMQQVGTKILQWNVAIDFLFIIAYTLFFSFCCKALMNNYTTGFLKTVGLIFLELSVLVGVLDLVENIAMLITLGGYGSNISVAITKWAAILKFVVAALVIVYILIASVVMYLTKKKKA